MDQNRCKFNLCFAKTLEELVRNGSENVPLEAVPMNHEGEPVPPRVEFCLIDSEIVPGLSSGRRDEIYSICLLPIRLCMY